MATLSYTSAVEHKPDTVALSVPIAEDASASDVIDVGHLYPIGVIGDPDAWTTATLGFQVLRTEDDASPAAMKAGPDEYTVDMGVDEAHALSFETLFPFRYLKLVSGSPTTPVAQAGDRVLTLILAQ